MFLFDVFSFGAENTQAVGVAQRLCHTIRVVPDVSLTGDFDVFIAMTWSFIVKILIRESKRLVAQDNLLGELSVPFQNCESKLILSRSTHRRGYRSCCERSEELWT